MAEIMTAPSHGRPIRYVGQRIADDRAAQARKA